MTLQINDLSVSYGSRKVISHFTLSAIPEGSLVAVIGPNAVGKSTLLKSLAGLLKYSGNISLHQRVMRDLPHREVIKHVGYLPQTLPQPTTLVAYELVYSACRAVCGNQTNVQLEASIERVFRLLGIHDLALRRLSEMSGGQRQMVGLAQVLVRHPSLLLLDEPTSALDLHWQLNVLEAIREETHKTKAIALIASHDLNLALRFCDQLIMLGPGGVLAMGEPMSVLTPEHLRTAYGIEGRVERCSRGYPIVLADSACI
ncbi:ABC transporter [Gammaproteobacteria bacterium 45_16_T64]|nr:ABC transporter [Gammaproteobacteria bacterium 45_16_T64]